MFILGLIIGLLISILTFVILAFFRSAIEKKIIVVEKALSNAGPKPRGFIIEPKDEIELIREEIIKENKIHGKDTKISELL